MLCDNCKSKQASVLVTKIINGEKTQIHLCDDCAQEANQYSFTLPQFGLFHLLSGLLPTDVTFTKPTVRKVNYDEPECEVCHLSYRQFARTGRFGCSHCYETFGDSLEPLFKKIHGAVEHTGKYPQKAGSQLKTKKEIRSLREALTTAVNHEEYERAAQLRDQIRDLEKKLGGE